MKVSVIYSFFLHSNIALYGKVTMIGGMVLSQEFRCYRRSSCFVSYQKADKNIQKADKNILKKVLREKLFCDIIMKNETVKYAVCDRKDVH